MGDTRYTVGWQALRTSLLSAYDVCGMSLHSSQLSHDHSCPTSHPLPVLHSDCCPLCKKLNDIISFLLLAVILLEAADLTHQPHLPIPIPLVASMKNFHLVQGHPQQHPQQHPPETNHHSALVLLLLLLHLTGAQLQLLVPKDVLWA